LTLVTFYEVEIPFSSSLAERTASVQDVKRPRRRLGELQEVSHAGPNSPSASNFSEIGQRQTSTLLTLLRNYSVQSAFLCPQNSLPFWKTAARTADAFVGKTQKPCCCEVSSSFVVCRWSSSHLLSPVKSIHSFKYLLLGILQKLYWQIAACLAVFSSCSLSIYSRPRVRDQNVQRSSRRVSTRNADNIDILPTPSSSIADNTPISTEALHILCTWYFRLTLPCFDRTLRKDPQCQRMNHISQHGVMDGSRRSIGHNH
jgi:hypothetical protein